MSSGGVAGAFISLLIIQDGTGSRTVTFNVAYEFKDDTAPTLTTTASTIYLHLDTMGQMVRSWSEI